MFVVVQHRFFDPVEVQVKFCHFNRNSFFFTGFLQTGDPLIFQGALLKLFRGKVVETSPNLFQQIKVRQAVKVFSCWLGELGKLRVQWPLTNHGRLMREGVQILEVRLTHLDPFPTTNV